MHPVYARLLCAELLRRGFSRETVLGGTGLAWEALHTGAAFLSYAQLQRLVHQALVLTGEPGLGLAVGLSTELSIHGDRKSTRLNSSHSKQSRMPSSA